MISEGAQMELFLFQLVIAVVGNNKSEKRPGFLILRRTKVKGLASYSCLRTVLFACFSAVVTIDANVSVILSSPLLFLCLSIDLQVDYCDILEEFNHQSASRALLLACKLRWFTKVKEILCGRPTAVSVYRKIHCTSSWRYIQII